MNNKQYSTFEGFRQCLFLLTTFCGCDTCEGLHQWLYLLHSVGVIHVKAYISDFTYYILWVWNTWRLTSVTLPTTFCGCDTCEGLHQWLLYILHSVGVIHVKACISDFTYYILWVWYTWRLTSVTLLTTFCGCDTREGLHQWLYLLHSVGVIHLKACISDFTYYIMWVWYTWRLTSVTLLTTFCGCDTREGLHQWLYLLHSVGVIHVKAYTSDVTYYILWVWYTWRLTSVTLLTTFCGCDTCEGLHQWLYLLHSVGVIHVKAYIGDFTYYILWVWYMWRLTSVTLLTTFCGCDTREGLHQWLYLLHSVGVIHVKACISDFTYYILWVWYMWRLTSVTLPTTFCGCDTREGLHQWLYLLHSVGVIHVKAYINDFTYYILWVWYMWRLTSVTLLTTFCGCDTREGLHQWLLYILHSVGVIHVKAYISDFTYYILWVWHVKAYISDFTYYILWVWYMWRLTSVTLLTTFCGCDTCEGLHQWLLYLLHVGVWVWYTWRLTSVTLLTTFCGCDTCEGLHQWLYLLHSVGVIHVKAYISDFTYYILWVWYAVTLLTSVSKAYISDFT